MSKISRVVAAPTLVAGSDPGAELRRMRLTAIALMCGAGVCFTGLDSSAKWLGAYLPAPEVVWARFMVAALLGVLTVRPFSRPALLWPRRPGLQALRSILLLLSTSANFFALRRLQLAETSTISFLTPFFVAGLALPILGERIGPERIIAIVVGFVGVLIATRPGTSAFQPIVFVAIAGVICNSGYVLLTRALAAHDAAETTMAWTQLSGVVCISPILPWWWVTPPSLLAWAVMGIMGASAALGHGLLIQAHRLAPAPFLTPFAYVQLPSMIVAGLLVFGDWPPPATLIGAGLVVACGVTLAMQERRGARGVKDAKAAGE
jgi:drug/metabolite transporter (DMT)-like permease